MPRSGLVCLPGLVAGKHTSGNSKVALLQRAPPEFTLVVHTGAHWCTLAFCPCSSLPVRKKTSRPARRWKRAITSAVTASYACLCWRCDARDTVGADTGDIWRRQA